jgi:hypothetical protein
MRMLTAATGLLLAGCANPDAPYSGGPSHYRGGPGYYGQGYNYLGPGYGGYRSSHGWGGYDGWRERQRLAQPSGAAAAPPPSRPPPPAPNAAENRGLLDQLGFQPNR